MEPQEKADKVEKFEKAETEKVEKAEAEKDRAHPSVCRGGNANAVTVLGGFHSPSILRNPSCIHSLDAVGSFLLEIGTITNQTVLD